MSPPPPPSIQTEVNLMPRLCSELDCYLSSLRLLLRTTIPLFFVSFNRSAQRRPAGSRQPASKLQPRQQTAVAKQGFKMPPRPNPRNAASRMRCVRGCAHCGTWVRQPRWQLDANGTRFCICGLCRSLQRLSALHRDVTELNDEKVLEWLHDELLTLLGGLSMRMEHALAGC